MESYVHFHMHISRKLYISFVCTYAFYFCLLPHFYAYFQKILYKFLYAVTLSTFVCYPIFVPLQILLWCQWKYCLFVSVSIFLPISVWPFTFTGKSDCDVTFTLKIELVVFLTSIITIKVTQNDFGGWKNEKGEMEPLRTW